MKKKECPSCAMEIEATSKICPICGYEFSASRGVVVWVAVGLLALLAVYFLLHSIS